MKKLIAATAVLAAASAVPALAQSKNFEGFSLGANVEFDRASVDTSDGSSDSGNSTGAGLQAQYAWGLGSNFVLGVGATASTGNRKAGAYATGFDAYTKDRYAFDIIPGIAVTENTLVYAKISSLSGTGASSDGSSTSSLQGMGYGLGVRGMIDRNAYWQAGYDTYRYNDVTFGNGTMASFKGNVLSVGVGYKF